MTADAAEAYFTSSATYSYWTEVTSDGNLVQHVKTGAYRIDGQPVTPTEWERQIGTARRPPFWRDPFRRDS